MEEVINYIKNLNINSKVVLACSYGPDSMCLLDILKKLDINVIVAHVNHKLRSESDLEYELLEKYCIENNLIFEGYAIDDYPKGNIENIARIKRYNFFEKIVRKYDANYLFTAHHGDDLVETVLMRISRGSSFKGYAGFNIFTKTDKYNLVRPLIFVTKNDIEKYNKINNIPYAIDKTNLELVHTRNIYRHKILPEFKEINPKIHKKFIKFSNNIIDYYNYVDEEVIGYKSVLYDEKKYLDINEVINLPEFIVKLLVQKILFEIYNDDISRINDKHVRLVMDLIYSGKANKVINLPENKEVYKFYNKIEIKDKENINNYDYELNNEINLELGKIFKVDFTDIVKSNYLIRLNFKDIKLPIHVRNRTNGDKMELKNGTKKVGEILSEAKINRLDRDRYPIVCDDNNKILWIPGVKKSKFDRQINEDYDIIIKYIKKESINEKK